MKSFFSFISQSDCEPKKTNKVAILCIDMINEFCSKGGWCDLNHLDYQYYKKCLSQIQQLLKVARSNDIPIIWLNWGIKDINQLPQNQFYLWKKKPSDIGLEAGCFQYGSWGTEIIPELERMPQELLISKERISGFYDGSDLHPSLTSMGVQDLYLVGINTDQCVLHTMADGNFLGYNCVLIQNCCATNSPPHCEKAAIYNAGECFGKVKQLSEVIVDITRAS